MQAAFLDTSAPTGGFQSFRALKQGTQRALIDPRTRAIYVGSIRLSQRFRWEESDGVADSFTRRGGSEVQATLKLELEARNERTTALLRKKPLPARLVELNRFGGVWLEDNLKATATGPRSMVPACVRPCGGSKSWRCFW